VVHFYTGTVRPLGEIKEQCDEVYEKNWGLSTRCCRKFRVGKKGPYHVHRGCLWIKWGKKYKKVFEATYVPRLEKVLIDILKEHVGMLEKYYKEGGK